MAMEPAARAGMALCDVDTPALIIDLDAFERNLRRMADAAAKAGLRLRPHAKTHKSAIIAKKQIELGAVGVCCQKVSEAEILAKGGVPDVLVSNEIAGVHKIQRLVSLAKEARIGVCVDNLNNVRELAEAAERGAVKLSVLLEIDVGSNRCGVAPGEAALRIASEIAGSNSLHFAGLQAYHGAAQHMRSDDERRNAIARATELTRNTVELLSRNGIPCGIVSGAGTGTFEFEAASGVFNEIQTGSYILGAAAKAQSSVQQSDKVLCALYILWCEGGLCHRTTGGLEGPLLKVKHPCTASRFVRVHRCESRASRLVRRSLCGWKQFHHPRRYCRFQVARA